VKYLSTQLQRAIAGAASLTGKRFGLLVASSLVATSAIVATAMTGSGGLGPLAGLVGRSLAANETPAATTPAPVTPEPAVESAGSSSQPSAGAEAASSGPLPSSAPLSPEPEPEPAPEETPTPAPEEAPEPGPVKHIFVISLASSGYEAAFGTQSQMPYLSGTLRPEGDLLSNYSLLDDASLPNAVATVSGQQPNEQTKQNCPTYSELPPTATANKAGVVSGSGCVYPVETLTLASQLEADRLTWRAYMGSMVDETGKPANCVHPEPDAAETPVTGGYSFRLNPFVLFHSLLDLGGCSSNDVPETGLEEDLGKTKTTANFTYVAPNLCEAGYAGQCPAGQPEGAAAADAYLARVVPKILASPAYKADGLLIVAFGAANPVPAAEPGQPATPQTDLKTGALLLSPFLTPGATDGAAYDPYSVLRSSEDLFGLLPLAKAGAKGVRSFASSFSVEDGGD
jgi:hypothetical protein